MQYAIPRNCMLPTNSSTKCVKTSILYYRRTLLQLFKRHWIFFFSSSDTLKSYHLLGCHATNINFLFNPFLNVFFFRFDIPSQTSDKNNSIRIIFLIISIKINIIKVCIKNIHSITNK